LGRALRETQRFLASAPLLLGLVKNSTQPTLSSLDLERGKTLDPSYG
jgi:hypothetical protein